MTQHEVRSHLIHHFKHHQLGEHMDLPGGILGWSSNQNPDGDIVERKQLYIREQVSIPCGAECEPNNFFCLSMCYWSVAIVQIFTLCI